MKGPLPPLPFRGTKKVKSTRKLFFQIIMDGYFAKGNHNYDLISVPLGKDLMLFCHQVFRIFPLQEH